MFGCLVVLVAQLGGRICFADGGDVEGWLGHICRLVRPIGSPLPHVRARPSFAPHWRLFATLRLIPPPLSSDVVARSFGFLVPVPGVPGRRKGKILAHQLRRSRNAREIIFFTPLPQTYTGCFSNLHRMLLKLTLQTCLFWIFCSHTIKTPGSDDQDTQTYTWSLSL